MKISRIQALFIAALLYISLLRAPAAFAAGSVTLDGSLNPANTGPVGSGVVNGAPTTYLITENLGARSGANLFHSFGTFNIGAGESATFTGSVGIANIISRVTGGSPSTIEGQIRSTIPGADLYLLNPNGVMFGAGASLDLGGSFHVSTADYLKFTGGDIFYANPSSASVLSVAPVEAFGFLGLGATPAPIAVDRAVLQVPAGKTISLIGGDITALNDPAAATYYDYVNFLPGASYYTLSAPGGRINLVSVASSGEVNMSAADLGMSSFSGLANITFINGANINAQSDIAMSGAAGSVVIRGGRMLIMDSVIDAGGDPAGVIYIAGGSLQLDNATIALFNMGQADHLDTSFNAELTGDFTMTNAAGIFASVYGAGRGGNITVSADNIKLGDDTPGTGPLADYGYYGAMMSDTYGGGRAGDVSFSASRNMVVQNGYGVIVGTYDVGNAGNVSVTADSLAFKNQGNIASLARGFGNGGVVNVSARDILISATDAPAVINSNQITGIGAQTDALSPTANGGRIVVAADSLSILDGGKLSTILYSDGRGADIELNARNMTVSGYYTDVNLTPGPYALSAVDGRVIDPRASGTGGNISLTVDNLTLSNGGAVRTALYGNAPGNAGDITVNARTIDINSLGRLYADSFRGTGNSGNITINAGTMNITGIGNAAPPAPLDFTFTGISTSTRDGVGGAVNATLTGGLGISSGGGIQADTQGAGVGGAISIGAKDLALTGGSFISSASTGAGNAGDVTITAAASLRLHNSSITTEAVLSDGGNIRITAPYLVSVTDGRITASVGGGASTTGGNIDIDPQFVVLNNGQIVANAYAGTGGNIRIVSDTFLSDPQSAVDASSALGVSGTVDIQAPINNVSGLMTPLSADFTSAAGLLRDRCIARIKGGKYNSFIIGGRDGLPVEPDGLLPAILN